MNNSRSFEDDVDEGPRERLLVGDGARQRRQGRPFLGGDVLLLARPPADRRPIVKTGGSQVGVLSTRQVYVIVCV